MGTMVRDAQQTRQRLLDAAAEEFAAYGIAGARVDRIAAKAGCNKALLYHHFDSKEGLFDAVFDAMCVATVSETPIDPHDLPEYAARLFDSFEAHPERARLASWYRLEHGGEPLDAVLASMRGKAAQIEQAQRAGILPDRYEAVELLTLILNLSTMWASVTPDLARMTRRYSRAKRRQLVIEAVHDHLAER
jgi:AcrR family transcriptional regulator